MKTRFPAVLVLVALLLAFVGFSHGGCSISELARPYKGLKYNSLNGYVDMNGKIRRVPYGVGTSSYNAIGCSAFVVPMLNRILYQNRWLAHQRQNWRLYQKTGTEIADGFGLSYACTLTPAQVKSPALIRDLIAQKWLIPGQVYLLDTRRGAAGHTGFVQVMGSGFLKTYMFSGIGKGTDGSDDTIVKLAKSGRERPAPRSRLSGYTEGSFASWYQSSQYRGSRVRLFKLPTAVPDTLAGEGGTIGDSLGTLSGCTDTAQLSVASKVSVFLSYNCEQRKGIATVTGTMDANSANNGLSTYFYTWRGTMTWNGGALTGVLVRQDRSDRPSMTLTIRPDEEGNFFASMVVPYTFVLYLLDGSCTTAVTTFDYPLNQVPLQIP